jgi:predicted porin
MRSHAFSKHNKETDLMTRTLTLSLIAMATMATAMPVAHAQSSVTINGVLDLFGGARQLAGAQRIKRLDSGGMTTSRWGLEGNEDLGGGLKAQFAMTGFIRMDTGQAGRNDTDAFWQRYAYVGLQSSAGTVRLGRQTTPTFASAIRFNPFAESTVFAPYLLHMYAPAQPLLAPINPLDSAASNAVTYASPVFAGVSLSSLYSAGEQTSGGINRSALGANYTTGPFAVSVTTERTKIAGQFAANASKLVNVQGGTSYDLGVAKLFAQASRTTLDLIAGGERKFATYQVGTSVPVGLGSFLLSFAQTKKDEPLLADIKRRTTAIGYDYALSKRTDVYLIGLNDRVTNLANGNTVAAGMRHRF